MRNRCNVADDSEIETDRLERTDGGFATGAWPPNENLDFLQSVPHRLARRILRNHLRGVGCALARAFETDFAGARPADHVAVQISDGDDGVVESGEDVGETGVNVLAPLRLDDLRLLDVVRIERKIFLRRFGGGGFRLFRCFFAAFGFASVFAGGSATSAGRARRLLQRSLAVRS